MKDLCLIYANCQGRAIETFLLKNDTFRDSYEVKILENYKMIEEQSALPVDLLQKAKLFIYQPVHSRHGSYATDYIKRQLLPSCRTISFPYLYNDGLWPLFEEGETIKGEEIIVRLMERGFSLAKIINMFCAEQIDFEIDRRFQRSIAILKQKEQATDVKVTEYILTNLGKEKLFLTQNHQTTAFYTYCVNQMLLKLGYNSLNTETKYHPNEAQLPDCWPQSPYETKIFHYQFISEWEKFHPERVDSNWHRFYLRIINKIYCRHTDSLAACVFSKIYTRLMIEWSIIRGAGYLE